MPTKRVSLLALLLWPLLAAALPGDGDQPIEVEADQLELRDDDNLSVYEGNVRLVQGSLEISSDRLVIHFNDQRELVLMEMSGSPATFRQLDDEGKEMLGRAGKINYIEAESRLELFEDARFSHNGDTIESNRISIDTESNAIQAGNGKPDERVKMLIKPRASQAE